MSAGAVRFKRLNYKCIFELIMICSVGTEQQLWVHLQERNEERCVQYSCDYGH